MPAKHTPPGDDSFRRSLLRSGAGAVGLVAVVALVFGLIGGLGPTTDAPLVAGDGGDPDEEPDDERPPPAEPDPGDEPASPGADDEADADVDEDLEPDPEPEPDPESEPDPEPEPDEAEEAQQEGDEASEEPARDEDGDREFAPDSVTIQVLDGYQDDGGSAASSVTASLRELGYRVVAENPALRYEVTTVLWTPGFEAQAQQVASDLGAAEVRQQPGNLSDQVQVHVVVGADRG